MIYCFTITVVLAFFLGFVLGYIFGSSNGTKTKEPIKNVTYECELPKDYAAFLSYDGIPRQ